MSAIGDEVAEIVTDLAAASLVVTADPTEVQALLSQEGYAVLVGPPEVTGKTLAGNLALLVPVHVVVCPPGGLTEYLASWGPLEICLAVLQSKAAERVALTLGDQVFPTYKVDAARRTAVSPAP